MSEIYVKDLIRILIGCSEISAEIAKKIREDETLLELLVEEKKGDAKNPRFRHDFKSLADVLIQEVIKYHVTRNISSLSDRIYGEESNVFRNRSGSSVAITMDGDIGATASALASVLDCEVSLGNRLAEIAYSEPICDESQANEVHAKAGNSKIYASRLGIWIDPIDSTSQYIRSRDDSADISVRLGLTSVTILIGVFSVDTGYPVLGVVNQPFASEPRVFWGYNGPDLKINNVSKTTTNERAVICSSSEFETIRERLTNWDVSHFPGCGYKVLSVIRGSARFFLLTKASSFCWDTCAGHAILLSQGGGVVRFGDLVTSRSNDRDELASQLESLQVRYYEKNQSLSGINQYSNQKGILVYADSSDVFSIYSLLRGNL